MPGSGRGSRGGKQLCTAFFHLYGEFLSLALSRSHFSSTTKSTRKMCFAVFFPGLLDPKSRFLKRKLALTKEQKELSQVYEADGFDARGLRRDGQF